MSEEEIKELFYEDEFGNYVIYGYEDLGFNYSTDDLANITNDFNRIGKYIEQLQQENKYLKMNNPEQNIEHFKIINENKRKINNLRKENKELKENIDVMTKAWKNNVKKVKELSNILNELESWFVNIFNETQDTKYLDILIKLHELKGSDE